MFEQIISYIAPHTCLSCHQEGLLLCSGCQMALSLPVVQRHGCGHDLCGGCNKVLKRAFAATHYRGLAKQLIHKLKFDRAAAAADVMAQVLARRMPHVMDDSIISFVPTATGRVRVRGYDQSALIAQRVARLQGVACVPLLVRTGQQRQVGQARETRRTQLRGAFEVRSRASIQGQTVLLVDDVLTTGATLDAAAAVLYAAGARKVDAAVFAAA